ncbi:protein NYNRIN-like [Telopea speciosissima]|uniref:protein NYNRIN-like n=1 Tax=Telopea speciosissima TaxID=54955 RepID=UPI001CC388CA|nr:protein NYNRIN-like [Telopea speciosissima]
MAEYEAYAIGLEAALSIGLKRTDVFGDSSLVICQMQGKWKTKDEKLIPYQEHVEVLSKEFKEITFSYLPRDNNQFADALATLESMVEMESGTKELHTLSSPWPFATWGIDVIGQVIPTSSNGHEYILVAINYFTKWVEVQSYAKLIVAKVAKFISNNIMCRYGVPHELISDQGSHFRGEVKKLSDKMNIQRHASSPYKPQTNSAVDVANKNIKRIIKKMTDKHNDWAKNLPYALWAYRTFIPTSIGTTPYSFVYGMEAVLLVELEIPSLRLTMDSDIPETEWIKTRFQELNLVDKKRMRAIDNMKK